MADSATTDSCCALCIGQGGGLVDYDPVDCAASSSSGRVCCSSCTNATARAPSVLAGEVSAGQWIQLSWPHVHRVTYEVFAGSENITRTVTNSSAEAYRAKSNGSSSGDDGESLFRICAAEPGVVLVRGWGDDSCSTTTHQYQIQITSANATDSNATMCVTEVQSFASDYSVWGDQDEVGSEDSIPCNYKHATLVTDANGNQTCVCSTEWTGAPDCNGYVWWKIVLAAFGTLAILFAVFVLFCACTKSRRQARRAQRSAAAAAAAAPPMTLRRTSFEATMVDDMSFFSAAGVSPFDGYDGSGRRESLYRYHPHAHFSPAFRNKSDAKARSLIYN